MRYNPQESLENTINTMGTLVGVHPIVPWFRNILQILNYPGPAGVWLLPRWYIMPQIMPYAKVIHVWNHRFVWGPCVFLRFFICSDWTFRSEKKHFSKNLLAFSAFQFQPAVLTDPRHASSDARHELSLRQRHIYFQWGYGLISINAGVDGEMLSSNTDWGLHPLENEHIN